MSFFRVGVECVAVGIGKFDCIFEFCCFFVNLIVRYSVSCLRIERVVGSSLTPGLLCSLHDGECVDVEVRPCAVGRYMCLKNS